MEASNPDVAKVATNPKDLLGMKKNDLSTLPAIAIYHASHAMTDGAFKYGPYNWRGNRVLARVYIAACLRHILRWACGETYTTDTNVHNLGAAIACLGILLDAEATGNLGDDRAHSADTLRAMDEVDAKVKSRTSLIGPGVTTTTPATQGDVVGGLPTGKPFVDAGTI